MSNIFELAINQSKPNRHDEFLSSRQAFVDVLAEEEATNNEGKWKPFFTVDPNAPLDRILIGMTDWKSLEGFGEAAARLMPQPEAQAYFATFDQVVYALLSTLDGKAFDMESIKQPGQVIEFAVRKGTSDDAFGAPRDAFFSYLETQDGYAFAREFTVQTLDENNMPQAQVNTQAVIIAWESMETFQAVAQKAFNTDEYKNFFAKLEVQAYFASSVDE